MKNNKHWISFVDEKRRMNLLLILEELSTLVNKEEPDFIIIGAMALLIQDFIRGYKVLWDIDLLFKNCSGIMDFRKKDKASNLRIVELDDSIIQNKNIGSLHSVWSFNKTWFNVDYIIKGDFFTFYNPQKRRKEPYRETIRFKEKNYHISLFLADPVDIFTEKMICPRMERELEIADDFGVDIRHCLHTLQRFGNEERFWESIKKSAQELNAKEKLKNRLITLIAMKEKLGYAELKLPEKIHNKINDF